MKPLTYRQLLAALKELGDEQLDMSVTVINAGEHEAYPVQDVSLVSELDEDVLDEWDGTLEDSQPVLIIPLAKE